MRGSVIVLIILMLNIVSNAQDWIEKDGIEYNCAVVLSILGDYGDESLTRQLDYKEVWKITLRENFRRALIPLLN